MYVAEDTVIYSLAELIKSINTCVHDLDIATNRGFAVNRLKASKKKITIIVDEDKQRYALPDGYIIHAQHNYRDTHGFYLGVHPEVLNKYIIVMCPAIERWIIQQCRISSVSLYSNEVSVLKKYFIERTGGNIRGNTSLRAKDVFNRLLQSKNPALLHLQEIACTLA